ncbi:MAG: PspC domain-containing protein [Acidobacteriaceae bacterium]
MFCKVCGKEISAESKFCSNCGASVAGATETSFGQTIGAQPIQGLIRPRNGRMIAGVCAGLSRAYGWDISLVRVITVLITIVLPPVGILGYPAAWLLVPEEPLLPVNQNPSVTV